MQTIRNTTGLLAVFWLVARVALGWHWLDAGLDKLGESAWTGANGGAAVTGFLGGAIERSQAAVASPEVGGWFATLAQDVFLPQAELFGYFVVIGEVAVGVALLAGLLTKFSAGVGLLMNLAFLLAGTSGSNPYMLVIAAGLIVAVAPGRIGADAFVMPVVLRGVERVRRRPQWKRWAGRVALAVGVLVLGFLSYVMLEDDVTFAAVFATAIPVGLLWLLAERRLTRDAAT